MKKSNKKIKKRSKYPIKVNRFDPGGDLNGWQQAQADAMEGAKNNPAGTGVALAQGAMELVKGGMSNFETDTSKADTAIDAVKNFQPSTSSLDALAKDYNSLDYASTDWKGSDFSVSTGQGLANMGKTAMAGAAAGAVLGPWGAVAGAAAGLIASGAGWIAGASKAKDLAAQRNAAAREANYSAQQRALASRDTIQDNITNQFLSNVAARGGSLKHRRKNMFTEDIEDNMINDLLLLNGIQHAYGGDMRFTGDFTNGVTLINEGGTHEENPYEGVLMGVDYQGTPNLVEEGEVVWNDYVFSNRLKPSKEFKKNFKLSGETFADVAKYIQKESEERPNDPISKRGLEFLMNELMKEHEMIRNKDTKNRYAEGGYIESEEPQKDSINTSQLAHDLLIRMSGGNPYETKKQRLARQQEEIKRKINQMVSSDPLTLKKLLESVSQDREYKTGRKANKFKGGGAWLTDTLRYMPAISSLVATGLDAFGVTNNPDHKGSQEIKDVVNNQTDVSTRRIDTNLNLQPLDTNFYYNRQAAQAAANRQAIANNALTSGQAIAGLLAANQNDQMQSAVLARQATELANEQALKEATFDMTKQKENAGLDLQEAALRHSQDKLKLTGIQAANTLEATEDAAADAARSANMNALTTSIGNIGTDMFNRQQSDMLLSSGVYGTLSMKPAWWSDKQWADYQAGLAAQRTPPATPTTPAGTINTPPPQASSYVKGTDPSLYDVDDEEDPYWYTRAKGGKIKRRRKIKKGLTY